MRGGFSVQVRVTVFLVELVTLWEPRLFILHLFFLPPLRGVPAQVPGEHGRLDTAAWISQL